MTKPSLLLAITLPLVFALALVGCKSKSAAGPHVGKYVGWMGMASELKPLDGSEWMTEKLELREDGTYVHKLVSRVMINVDTIESGTYVIAGSEISFKGTVKGTVDDGYKKSPIDRENEWKARIDSDGIQGPKRGDLLLIFRKEGSGPPPVPHQATPIPSGPPATEQLKKIEKAYADLKSIRVTGVMKSDGTGFQATEVKFKLLFERPSKLRYEAAAVDGGKEWDRTEITWGGEPTCWWYSREFGPSTDRDLGNALSICQVGLGSQSDLLAYCLVPYTMKSRGLSKDNAGVTLLPDEEVDGRPCMVLDLLGSSGGGRKIWVDKSTNLIVQMVESSRNSFIRFKNEPNVKLTSADFSFGKLSKAK